MKKQYIVPQTDLVNVRLNSSVLGPDKFGDWGKGGDEADAKENNTEFEEESLINPTQPNLWDDNEEE